MEPFEFERQMRVNRSGLLPGPGNRHQGPRNVPFHRQTAEAARALTPGQQPVIELFLPDSEVWSGPEKCFSLWSTILTPRPLASRRVVLSLVLGRL